jgi:hypothetical protein
MTGLDDDAGMIPFILFRASSSVTAGQAFRKTPLQVQSVLPPGCGHRASRSPPEMVLQMPLPLRWMWPPRKPVPRKVDIGDGQAAVERLRKRVFRRPSGGGQ